MAIIAELLKGKMAPAKAGAMPMGDDENEDMGGGMRAAEDLMAAVKSGDAKALMGAFERMMTHCQGESSTDEE